MTGSYSYPAEYGIEAGETCYRGRCRGQMILTQPECSCWHDALYDLLPGEPVPETFICGCEPIAVCGECGGPDFD